MKKTLPVKCVALLGALLVLVACQRKTEPAQPFPAAPVAASPTASPAPSTPEVAPAAAAESEESNQRAEKVQQLEVAKKEAEYLNDPRGQWAISGTSGPGPSGNDEQYLVGVPDNLPWIARGAAGIDWAAAEFARPVAATEVRVVVPYGAATVTQLSLQDTDGAWHEVWSGLSDETHASDKRVWWVRSFEKTPYAVKAVKVGMAALDGGTRGIDAVQLVGE